MRRIRLIIGTLFIHCPPEADAPMAQKLEIDN